MSSKMAARLGRATPGKSFFRMIFDLHISFLLGMIFTTACASKNWRWRPKWLPNLVVLQKCPDKNSFALSHCIWFPYSIFATSEFHSRVHFSEYKIASKMVYRIHCYNSNNNVCSSHSIMMFLQYAPTFSASRNPTLSIQEFRPPGQNKWLKGC